MRERRGGREEEEEVIVDVAKRSNISTNEEIAILGHKLVLLLS